MKYPPPKPKKTSTKMQRAFAPLMMLSGDSYRAVRPRMRDIFLKVHVNIHELDGKEIPDAWIFSIARNRVIDHYSANKQHSRLYADSLKAPKREREEMLHEFTDDIHAMIKQLPKPEG